MENYETLGVIGEGTYGVVMKARHRETGQVVAIKKFKDSDDDENVRKTSLREVRVLKQLRHDNVITLLEVFRKKGKLHLVFEYVEKTILEVLERKPNGLDEGEVRRYTYQLLRAVDYCHSHNVIHRDVKPENILISKNGALKLCDFGFARPMSVGGRYTDYVATRWYRSPELLVGDVEYGKGVDVWAIGCIFAEVSNGMPLFPGESDVDQLAHIVRCFGKLTTKQAQTFRRNPLYVGVELPAPKESEPLDARFPNTPKPWLGFLKACLKNDPEQRESCTGLLSLPYFTDRNWKAEYEQELRVIMDREHRLNGTHRKESESGGGGTGPPGSTHSGSATPPMPEMASASPMTLPGGQGTSSSGVGRQPSVPVGTNPFAVPQGAKYPGSLPPAALGAMGQHQQQQQQQQPGALWSQYVAGSGVAGDVLPDVNAGRAVQQSQPMTLAQAMGANAALPPGIRGVSQGGPGYGAIPGFPITTAGASSNAGSGGGGGGGNGNPAYHGGSSNNNHNSYMSMHATAEPLVVTNAARQGQSNQAQQPSPQLPGSLMAGGVFSTAYAPPSSNAPALAGRRSDNSGASGFVLSGGGGVLGGTVGAGGGVYGQRAPANGTLSFPTLASRGGGGGGDVLGLYGTGAGGAMGPSGGGLGGSHAGQSGPGLYALGTGANSGAVPVGSGVASQLAYKKKPAKKNVISSLSLQALGASSTTGGGGGGDQLGGFGLSNGAGVGGVGGGGSGLMMLQGQSHATDNPQRRGSKPGWNS